MAQYIYTMNRVSKIVPPGRKILEDISDGIWDDGEWISWEWIDGQLHEQDLAKQYPEACLELMRQGVGIAVHQG